MNKMPYTLNNKHQINLMDYLGNSFMHEIIPLWARSSNVDPTKSYNQVLVKGKQFLLLIRHPPCYPCSQEVVCRSLYRWYRDIVYNVWVNILGLSWLSYMTSNLTLSSVDCHDGCHLYLYMLKRATCSVYYSNLRQRWTFHTYLLCKQLLCIDPHSNDRHLQFVVAHRMCLVFHFHGLLYPYKDIRYYSVKKNWKCEDAKGRGESKGNWVK